MVWTGLGGLRDGRLSVDLEFGEVGPVAEPYPCDACWARPDLDAVADAMRQLYDHPEMSTGSSGVGRERA